MNDDLATVTNTYPDHEDLQGPTGFDVATTISGFVPTVFACADNGTRDATTVTDGMRTREQQPSPG